MIQDLMLVTNGESYEDGTRHPINLPEVPSEEHTAKTIANRLQKGDSIVAWYCGLNEIDAFEVFKIKDGLLWEYELQYADEYNVTYIAPKVVRLADVDNYIKIFDDILSHCSHVYYDEENLLSQTVVEIPTDVTTNEVKNRIKGTNIFYIDSKRYGATESSKASNVFHETK